MEIPTNDGSEKKNPRRVKWDVSQAMRPPTHATTNGTRFKRQKPSPDRTERNGKGLLIALGNRWSWYHCLALLLLLLCHSVGSLRLPQTPGSLLIYPTRRPSSSTTSTQRKPNSDTPSFMTMTGNGIHERRGYNERFNGSGNDDEGSGNDDEGSDNDGEGSDNDDEGSDNDEISDNDGVGSGNEERTGNEKRSGNVDGDNNGYSEEGTSVDCVNGKLESVSRPPVSTTVTSTLHGAGRKVYVRVGKSRPPVSTTVTSTLHYEGRKVYVREGKVELSLNIQKKPLQQQQQQQQQQVPQSAVKRRVKEDHQAVTQGGNVKNEITKTDGNDFKLTTQTNDISVLVRLRGLLITAHTLT
ncbi:hypothetical protein Pmani_028724 [Petrolisthes manimaculis]|uniref:Uncharacterized protein n=1 Tax=Petrolisthes manimaculis TaxID=1843537 RepID=A0AAE1P1I6_9EUCA|nr:hypothetical protein Pmani_028724 [Petrolisthes manimaculis]